MMRTVTKVAALVAAGGVWWGTGEASACERSGGVTQAKQTARASGDLLQHVEVVLSAKCGCESAADCTCKKGQCACAKCKKHRSEMMQPLQGTPDLLKIENARHDASAGVFI